MEHDYLSTLEYDAARKKISDLREQKLTWDEIRNGKFYSEFFGDFDHWNKFQSVESRSWKSITEEEWRELVGAVESAEMHSIRLHKRGEDSILSSDSELNGSAIPQNPGTSWQMYRKTLKSNGFSRKSVDRIEKQTFDILKHLSNSTAATGPIKGLVIGNVQSGKTASMAGLMAMAADNGWNYFIVLTGLTENLRNQTEIRLRNDLKKSSGSLLWDYIGYSKMEDTHFEYEDFSDDRRVYFSVCLKNSKRLKTLLEFLHQDPHPEALRILIIDDEADQGSVNTGNIEDESKRKAINKLILDLVYGKGKDGKEFGAVNYVSYTATPYANCLNEFRTEGKKKTLYPENFISRISSGDGYFGPKIIFGMPGTEIDERLNIVNFIPSEQVTEVKELEAGRTSEIPEALQNSILWFICAAAVQRYRKYKKPVSMLVHTNFKVTAQDALYEAIRSWLYSVRPDVLERCRIVYQEQTEKFTLQDLENVFPDYEFLQDVSSYPEFSDLAPHIKELISEITTIRMDDEEKELTYNKGLLLCEDNSSKGFDDEGNQLRLVYPDKKQLRRMGYAPAFLVIGGNTLSRGLTLEGLVSSFFLRGSIQADSLMQMGRWFGYRKGYELLPRIWMTEETFEKFQHLVEIDEDLRDQIDLLSRLGKKPTDFQLSLKTSPKATWLRLTAKNKMQSATSVVLDYTGSDMQLVTYLKDPEIIRKNNAILMDFMHSLGKPAISEADGHSGIWRNIPFRTINDEIFEKGFRVAETSRTFQNIRSLREWIEAETGKGNFRNWTVILAGTRIDKKEPDKVFILDENFSIGKVSRRGTESGDDKVSIKVLTNKKDYTAHLRRSDFPAGEEGDELWKNVKSGQNMSEDYKKYIRNAHAEQTPLLLLYCIDKDSRPKNRKSDQDTAYHKSLAEMGITEDFLGMAVVIPGERGNHGVKMMIDKGFYDQDGDEENGD